MKHIRFGKALGAILLAALVVAIGGASSPASAQLGGFMWSPPAATCTGGYQGPGDVQSSWKVWVGLRAFTCATAGTKSINACTPSDATCQDINTLANGKLDEGALDTLGCNNSTTICTAKTGYDKSGNGIDITNATIANRPTIVRNCINTNLSCLNIAAGQSLLSATGIDTALPVTVSATAQRVSHTGQDIIYLFRDADGTGSSPGFDIHYPNADNTATLLDNSSTMNFTMTNATFQSYEAAFISGTGSWAAYVDGTQTTGTIASPAGPGGRWSVKSSGFSGDVEEVTEVGMVTVGLNSTQAGTLCHNKRLYWGTGGTC